MMLKAALGAICTYILFAVVNISIPSISDRLILSIFQPLLNGSICLIYLAHTKYMFYLNEIDMSLCHIMSTYGEFEQVMTKHDTMISDYTSTPNDEQNDVKLTQILLNEASFSIFVQYIASKLESTLKFTT